MARGDGLLLEVVDYKDPQRWRWVLKDASGDYLADQEVNLDLQDPNTTAILDLQDHLDRHSTPGDRMAEQKRLIDELSRWIGSKVSGKVACRQAGPDADGDEVIQGITEKARGDNS